MTDIGRWLDEHELGEYTELFVNNRIDLDVLGQITPDELKELGVPLGDRKRILSAVVTLAEADTGSTEGEAPLPKRPQPTTGEAERRQLTVMFCDLVDSTTLSRDMDAEDYRELLSAYQTAASGAVREHEGYIARYMGDGLLVYFGYPVAQENDPERATRAGLSIVEALARVESPVSLEVRIGIATGSVVVGDILGEGASQEAAVLGETPNLAARLQGVASPNTVLLAPTTQALLQGRVETQALAQVELKGFPHPIVPHRALRPRSLLELSDRWLESTPLVGRDVEIALLERAWARVQSYEGQAVLLSGEAGVGKSRLMRAFHERIHRDERVRVQWHCSPYYQTTANYPAIEQLRRSARLDGKGSDRALDALASLVERLGLNPAEQVPPLATLLSVPSEGRYTAPRWSPDELRRRLVGAQVELLRAAAKRAPVLFVVEDLHWADPTTLDVLEEMVTVIRDERVFFLMTARPEFSPPWGEQSHAATQPLNPLSRSETLVLVRGIVEERNLPTQVMEEIVDRTDGVPLFIEELTKSLLESSSETSIPASLQDSLMARLDRSGPTKELAQMAAVIGRTFSIPALASIARRSRESVEDALRSLVELGLVHRREEHEYEFKHALIRDAAYDSMLRSSRRVLHGRFAEYLQGSGDSQTQPEIQAQHHAAAAQYAEAVQCWALAGSRALTRSAAAEAVVHYQSALRSLQELPASPERSRMQIDCHLKVRDAYFARSQFEEGVPHLDSASVLVEGLDDRRRAALIAIHLTGKDWVAGDFVGGMANGQRALELAELDGDEELCALARYRLGIPYLQLGQLDAAREQFESAFQYFDSPQGRECFEFGGYTYCFASTFLAWTCAELGESERAVVVGRAGYRYASDRKHVYSIACAAFGLGWALILGGRTDEALTVLEETLTHPGSELASPIRYVFAQLAYVYAVRGDVERFSAMRQCFEATDNDRMSETWGQLWMARAELEAANLEPAEALLNAAASAAQRRQEEAAQAWSKLVRAELKLRRDATLDVSIDLADARRICDRLSLAALADEIDRVTRRTESTS